MNKLRIPFLSAEWKNLLVINYEIDPQVLKPFVPGGTELDDFQGKYFISLVGFLFLKTKLFGVFPTIFFNSFEEVNLRFYIKRQVGNELRRAVCFIREIVPSSIIAWTANTLYNESYIRLPMSHELSYFNHFNSSEGLEVCYRWKYQQNSYSLYAKTEKSLRSFEMNTVPYFILEHYWGYVSQKDRSTKEYKVAHPSWRYWNLIDLKVDEKVSSFYGANFAPFLKTDPHSAFLAEGSPVEVFLGEKFRSKYDS